MEKPKIKDFQELIIIGTIIDYRINYVAYSEALEKYIESTEPNLPLAAVSGQTNS